MSEQSKRRPTGVAWVSVWALGVLVGAFLATYVFEKNCTVLGKFRIGNTAYSCEVIE